MAASAMIITGTLKHSFLIQSTPTPAYTILIIGYYFQNYCSYYNRILAEQAAIVNEKQQRVKLLSNNSSASSRATSASSATGGTGTHVSGLREAVMAHNFYRQTWHKRKRLCMDVVDLISDGLGKKIQDVTVSVLPLQFV